MTLLADLTWPQAARLAAEGALLAVPAGFTEQHGPHLPLSTDTYIAVALAVRLAALRPGVVVAPPVSYGSSGEHAGFAGTLHPPGRPGAPADRAGPLGRRDVRASGVRVRAWRERRPGAAGRSPAPRRITGGAALDACAETRPGPAPAGRPRRADRDRAAAGPDPGPGPAGARRGREHGLAVPADARAAAAGCGRSAPTGCSATRPGPRRPKARGCSTSWLRTWPPPSPPGTPEP